MLGTRGLYFVPVGKLADVYEGHLPPESDDVPTPKSEEQSAEQSNERQLREHTCVSCWHMNDTESAAMWSLYATKNGLAVKSSVGRLLATLSEDGPGEFNVAAVQYVDRNTLD